MTHTITVVNVPNPGQRGPQILHQPTCSCGWVGTAALHDNAQYQHDHHVKTS